MNKRDHRLPIDHRRVGVMFCLLILLFSNYCFAEERYEYGRYSIEQITEADGLVSSDVTGMYKDEQGFLWISTFQGLSRYDGRRFTNYKKQSGLNDNNLEVIGEDAQHHLFVRSIGNVYRFTGNGIVPFFRYPVSGKFIEAACPFGDGYVCLAYSNITGFEVINRAGIIQKIPTKTNVTSIVKGLTGELYILESNGQMSIFKSGRVTQTDQIYPVDNYTDLGVKIYKDPSGKVWTYGANNKYLFARSGIKKVDSIAIPYETSWGHWTVGGTGNVYQSAQDGSVLLLDNGEWKTILTKEQIKGTIYEIYETGDGVLWIGASSGLFKATLRGYTNTLSTSPMMYYRTDKKGRYILHTDSLLFKIPNAVPVFYKLKQAIITNVYIARNRDVWFCTEHSVYRLAYGKSLVKLNTTNTYSGANILFRFRRVLEDDSGGVWISSYNGIFYWKNDKLSYYYKKEGIIEGALYSAAIDKHGLFYVAGYHIYVFKGNRFEDISNQLPIGNDISRLTTDQDKNVWICQSTNKIIKVGKRDTDRFFCADSIFCTVNGMPFNAGSMMFDTLNNLWICDNNSLYFYKYNHGSYRQQGYPLFWDECLSGNPLLYADDKNNLHVLSDPFSSNFLKTYATADLIKSYKASVPTLLLTSIQINQQPHDWLEAGYNINNSGIPHHPVFRYDQNFLRFYFTGLTKDFNSAIAYRYKLKGYNKRWSPPSEEGYAEYTGLPAGHYSLEIQARSAGSIWSKPLVYTFEILPVWYQQWWALVCWACLIMLAITGIILIVWSIFERRIALKRRLVEEQLKALRAQINPHFLQNTFTFLAHEMYSSQNTAGVKAIDRISNYLRKVLEFSDRSSVTLEEELEFAEEYLMLQQQVLSIPFDYIVNIGEDVDTFDVMVPSMLLQPLIENALKYGLDSETTNSIVITVDKDDAYIRCVVSDSGSRTPIASKLHSSGTGKGIDLTVERMNLFYYKKKMRPRFKKSKNSKGGCDAIIGIPIF